MYSKRYLYKGGIFMKIYLPEFNIFDKILQRIFVRYTEKVYRQGIKDGFNWNYKKIWEK